jgi:hypothetical protein
MSAGVGSISLTNPNFAEAPLHFVYHGHLKFFGFVLERRLPLNDSF